MVNKGGKYLREKKTLDLSSVIRKATGRAIETTERDAVVYNEDEARYVMWHLLHTIQKRKGNERA